VGGRGKAHAAKGARWEAEGRHRQRLGEVGGGVKAWAGTGRGGRCRRGIGIALGVKFGIKSCID